MILDEFQQLFARHPGIVACNKWLRSDQRQLAIDGLMASAGALVVGSVFMENERTMLVVMDDNEAAGYFYNDLSQFMSRERLAIFPPLYKNSHKQGATDKANEILRADTLNRLQTSHSVLVVTSPEALCEKVVSAEQFERGKIALAVGQAIATDSLCEELEAFGFEQVDFVYEPGQFSQRGSIVDIFSFANELPFRIDFFGDDIESIRTFDIEKQLSLTPQTAVTIVADIQADSESETTPLYSFLPPDGVVVYNDARYLVERVNQIYDNALIKANEQRDTPSLTHQLLTGETIAALIETRRAIEFSKRSTHKERVDFNQSVQPLFHKNFDIVTDTFRHYLGEGYKIYVASDSKKQTDRIAAIFADRGDDLPFIPIEKTIHEGFIDHDLKLCCFTDHQIFDRFHKFALRSDIARSGKVALTLKELNQFKVGDYVVHVDHGIGRFGGLLKTEMNGRMQEVIKLVYRGNDVIFVSIHALHRISKYKSKEGEEPAINKLGSGAWERLKERTKSKVKDIARDLIKLYAQRKAEQGFAYTPDTYLQQELEASFIYEDTPDQEKATAAIKHDMEQLRPMDRLVCGDVGFGKTEVAIRAAFKAVADNKQVAVLVPTTVLALQHYKTFSERLKNFPCKIAYISRAKTAKQVKEIEQQLASGEIDILIGTHKIVGKKILFKDLGLLIIDEEQKFGVAIKERLKQLKINVDTLTLTATPIPRTLQFSLMGARDLSIINTPPPNRYPILTEVVEADDDIIREAIVREMDRNGQVFFIHNRVQSIYALAEKVKKLVPGVRVAIAHGQMPPADLEETVVDFINYEADVLLATTVVESGIDMPNVNTIIVNKAHQFGLSDLHQLRGRVGRSNRKAYCYLIAPPVKDLTSDARRRLQAIETFADLGSGFNIAMQDLNIRGAGNMLGAEQSGFIADLGYETYQKILNEAMGELREEEFADLFADEQTPEYTTFVTECLFESDLDLMLPAYYITSVSERMTLYRELDSLTSEEALNAFQTRLTDRFGPIPEPALELIQVVRLRWMAMQLGVERLALKNGRMVAYLVSKTDSPYYHSNAFGAMLSYVSSTPRLCQFGANKERPSITFSPLKTIQGATRVLSDILKLMEEKR